MNVCVCMHKVIISAIVFLEDVVCIKSNDTTAQIRRSPDLEAVVPIFLYSYVALCLEIVIFFSVVGSDLVPRQQMVQLII